jgi:hypothetical protein
MTAATVIAMVALAAWLYVAFARRMVWMALVAPVKSAPLHHRQQ